MADLLSNRPNIHTLQSVRLQQCYHSYMSENTKKVLLCHKIETVNTAHLRPMTMFDLEAYGLINSVARMWEIGYLR